MQQVFQMTLSIWRKSKIWAQPSKDAAAENCGVYTLWPYTALALENGHTVTLSHFVVSISCFESFGLGPVLFHRNMWRPPSKSRKHPYAFLHVTYSLFSFIYHSVRTICISICMYIASIYKLYAALIKKAPTVD